MVALQTLSMKLFTTSNLSEPANTSLKVIPFVWRIKIVQVAWSDAVPGVCLLCLLFVVVVVVVVADLGFVFCSDCFDFTKFPRMPLSRPLQLWSCSHRCLKIWIKFYSDLQIQIWKILLDTIIQATFFAVDGNEFHFFATLFMAFIIWIRWAFGTHFFRFSIRITLWRKMLCHLNWCLKTVWVDIESKMVFVTVVPMGNLFLQKGHEIGFSNVDKQLWSLFWEVSKWLRNIFWFCCLLLHYSYFRCSSQKMFPQASHFWKYIHQSTKVEVKVIYLQMEENRVYDKLGLHSVVLQNFPSPDIIPPYYSFVQFRFGIFWKLLGNQN